jgi:TonB family protein
MIVLATCFLATPLLAEVDPAVEYVGRNYGDRISIRTFVPKYPDKALLERIQGAVEVCFKITRGGKPYGVAVRKSDHRIFERAARDAIRLSRFEAIPRGKEVPKVKMCRTYQFRLESAELAADTT